jgi:hypothetical protein
VIVSVIEVHESASYPWGAVLGGVGQTYLADDEEHDTVGGWGLGAELVF